MESSFPSSWIEGEGERTIARAVASRIRSPETVQRLLQSSLIAEGTTDEREKEIRQALQEQLTSGKLSLRDAFQIFYLMETGGVSNTLLFFKTAKLLDANGHHDFAVNRYHAVADRLYQAASEGPEALEALFAELHLTPEQKRELENVAFYAAEYASIAGQSMMDHVREFSSRHPFVATALGIGVVLPAAYTGYRFTIKPTFWAYAKIQWTLIENLADSDSDKIIAIAKKIGKTTEEISLAVHDAQVAMDRMKNAEIGFHLPGYRWRARRLGMRARRDAYGASSSVESSVPDQPQTPRIHANAAKAEDAVETLSEADEARLKTLLGKFGDVEDVKNVRAFLAAAAEQKLLKLDTDILALIDQSPGAQKIITGAVKSGEVTEVTRALRAARVARNWRIGFNAVGAVGDVFGLYMAVADFRENGRNLEQARNTGNAALREVYKGARVMNVVEGAEASASLGYGVTVIGWSWYTGQSFCTALSATGAIIMLPIAAVVLTAGATRRMTTNASEIWMRTAEDWVAALSPGELLEKLEEIGPGSQGTYSQRQTMGSFAEQSLRWFGSRHSAKAREGFRDWNEANARDIEGGNASARQEITKAYITHASREFLSPDAGEDQESYNKRFHQFVEDQMQYVEKITSGSFMRLRGGYDRARTYATLLAKSRALQAESKHEFCSGPTMVQVRSTSSTSQNFRIRPGKPMVVHRRSLFCFHIL